MHPKPPGPQDLPLVGATPYYARDPFRFATDLRDAYGDVAQFRLGRQQTYLVTTPAGVEQVLVDEADRFSKPDFQTDAMEELLGQGLLLSEGTFWRDMRTLAQPAFAPDRVAGLADMMAERTEALTARWEPGEVRDVESEMARLTVEIIVDAMFGADLGPERTQIVQENLEPLGRRFEPEPRRAVVPDWLPTPENRQYHAAIETLEGVIDDIVAERRDAVEDRSDLLSILLRAREDGDIDDRQVRDELMTMLLAGHDTTALALTYTWYLLSEHPEVERKVHEEIDAVVDGRPTFADVRELSYVRNVLDEAMRLYPPVYAMFRQPDRDVEIEGYDVPAGSLVMLSQWATHRDPRYFEEPEEFRPERWAESDHPTYAYFPFGAGPRSCIGKQFSLTEATIVLATIAREYRLDRVDDGELDLRGSLTMHPKDGVDVRIEPR
ncbi:Cytochrome P450 [Natronoarchaeum philippinense]|uniref:Cytochrome P450 n=1 Tax=Natronoarchaeum philippinense TaxID=558529 RepID=A0A285P1N1_NATPI|nr:cytochrome P450 [Natronoarchaeum philippinense]SNZ15644.1 Cytochrome P450 [Natronoarchaeum philippinense]